MEAKKISQETWNQFRKAKEEWTGRRKERREI